MIVCHCAVVSDHDVRDHIARGATDVCALAEACGAAQTCGGCLPAVRDELARQGLPTDEHLDPRTIRAIVRARRQLIAHTVAAS